MKSLLFSLSVVAAASVSAETWQGQGQVYGLQGAPQAQYTIEIVKTPVNANTRNIHVKVDLADGSTRTYDYTLQSSGTGWRMEGQDMSGGGRCFNAGLCQGYIGKDGSGFAITIVHDSASEERILKTELKNGEAVGFYVEKLTLKDAQ